MGSKIIIQNHKHNTYKRLHIAFAICIFVSLLPLLISILSYNFLPEEIPMHYNSEGQIGRWGSPWELILMGFVLSSLSLLMIFIFYKINSHPVTIIGEVGALVMAIAFTILQLFFTIKGNSDALINGIEGRIVQASSIITTLIGIIMVFYAQFLIFIYSDKSLDMKKAVNSDDDVLSKYKKVKFECSWMIASVILCGITVALLGAAMQNMYALIFGFFGVVFTVILSIYIYKSFKIA